MATWGSRVHGRLERIPRDTPPEKGVVYEVHYKASSMIPDILETQVLTMLRKVMDRVEHVKTRYIEVKGDNALVQFEYTGGSPFTIQAIVLAIVGVAVMFGLYLTFKALYKVVATPIGGLLIFVLILYIISQMFKR